MKLLAGVVIALALVIPGHAQAKFKVHCKQSGIHATISMDKKTYVLTSAIVCTSGKIVLKGKR